MLYTSSSHGGRVGRSYNDNTSVLVYFAFTSKFKTLLEAKDSIDLTTESLTKQGNTQFGTEKVM